MCYIVHFPVSWLLQWRLPAEFVRSLLGGEAVRCPPNLAALSRGRYRTWCDEWPANGTSAPEWMALELEALVRRMAQRAPTVRAAEAAASVRPVPPNGSGRGEQVAAYVVQHYAARLTAAQIGTALGVHPNHAMRVFARTFGISLWDYVGRLRVAHACYLLRTTDLKVVDVAAQSGFTSIGRFYTVFRRHARTTSPRVQTLPRAGNTVHELTAAHRLEASDANA